MEQSAGKLYITPNAIVGCGNPQHEAHTYSVSTVFVHPWKTCQPARSATDSCLVSDYWRLKKQVHTGNFIKQTGAWVARRTIHSYNTQAPRCQAGHQLGHRLEEDGLQTWTVEMWDCHWVPHLISISFCIDIVSSDDKPCLFSEGDAAPNHHTYTT